MGPKRNARSISRRLSPQSPKSAPLPQTRRTRGATYDTIQVADLPAVTEDDEDQDDSEGPAQDEIQESPPSQAASDSSSESQGEMEALNYDIMVESLLDLKADSIKLLDNLKAADLLEDRIRSIRDPSTPSARLFNMQKERLYVTRRAFGERIWTLPHILVRKFQSGKAWADTRDGAWRPDAIFYLSNLAQLIAILCHPKKDLEDVVACFPVQFSGTLSTDRFTTSFVQMLLQVGDEIRTQWFIQEARKRITHANFDPDELLSQVFFDGGYATRILPLAKQLGPDYDSTDQDRLKQLRSAFSKTSKNSIQLDKLDKMFPWDSVVFFTVGWVIQRREELEAMINVQTGGAEGIVEAIRAGHFNLDPVLISASDDLPAAPASRKTAKSTGRGGRGSRGGRVAKDLGRNIAALKKRQAELAAQQSMPLNPNLFENQETAAAAAALKPLIEATQQMDNGYAPLQDDDDNVPPSAQGQLSPTSSARQARDVMDVMARQAQQANKENLGGRQPIRSYMDPQPGAERVTWDLESHSGAPGPSGTNKRRQPSIDSESDDMEFEADSRQPKRPRPTSKGKGRATIHEPSSSHDQQYIYPSTQPSYPSTRSPLREQSRLPPSSAPVNFPAASQLPIGTPYTSINQLAKQNVTATRERDNRHIVQQRRPWTEEEVHRLMDLIAMNQGPKYAKILKDDNDASIFPDGPRLIGRNQVNLKDKARNVKMDYLKARQRLPDGFANVSVGKRMVEILRGMGIDYVEGEWKVVGTQDDEE